MNNDTPPVSLFKQALSFGSVLGIFLGLEETFLTSRVLFNGQSQMAEYFSLKVVGWTACSVLVFTAGFFLLSVLSGFIGSALSSVSRDRLSRECTQAFFSFGTLGGLFLFYGYRLLRIKGALTISHMSSIVIMATTAMMFFFFAAGAGILWPRILKSLWQRKSSFWQAAMWGAALGTIIFCGWYKDNDDIGVLKQGAVLGAAVILITALLWWLARKRSLTLIRSIAYFYMGMGILCLAALPLYTRHYEISKGIPSQGDVFLISIDTLRADGFSCTGSPVATPVIDSLAREGVVFERNYANAPWTMPSVASFLTSQYPSEVNMVMMTDEVSALSFPDSALTLAEILKPDFANHAILTNTMALGSANYWQGFDTAEAIGRTAVHPYVYLLRTSAFASLYNFFSSTINVLHRPNASMLIDRAIEHMDIQSEARNFLWLHFVDVHDPYIPPPPFDNPVPHYDGMLKERVGAMELMRKGRFLTPMDRAFIHRKYLANVQYIDQELGRFFKHLQQSGRWDDATIVVTSDHGEEFWEHRNVDHGHSVYNELVQVPLLIKLPKNQFAGQRITAPVSLIDLVPTIVDILDVKVENPSFRGKSLLPLLRGEAAKHTPIFIEGALNYGEQKSVIEEYEDGLWKLNYSVNPHQGRHWELFHMTVDPGERLDVSDLETDRLEMMKTLLEPFIRNQADKAAPIDPSVRDQLKALGYL